MHRHMASASLVCLLSVLTCPALAQDCVWRPWAADWSDLNKGSDLLPPNKVYNPAEWDYSFSQTTVLNLTKDTPTGGGNRAFHFFFDALQPATVSNKCGSGGVYQQITVTPGIPIQYSFYWKGKGGKASNWFEFHLIDGPFDINKADKFQESGTINSPCLMRKRKVDQTAFEWDLRTDQSPPDTGPAGPRPQTITPTGTIVTVVLKAGHSQGSGTPSGVEAFFDNVIIKQADGPNLVVNGDFEDTTQAPFCENEQMFQDSTQDNYWFGLTHCPSPQHTIVAPVSPASHDNAGETTLTITGTHLEFASGAKLVPSGGGQAIVASGLVHGTGTNQTSVQATFPTTGQAEGAYDLVTLQDPAPFCLSQQIAAAFTLTCPIAATFTDVTPGFIGDPTGPITLTISGTNLDKLTGAKLRYWTGETPATITASSISMSGDHLEAVFDVSCAPAGSYRLLGVRSDGCQGPVKENAFVLIKAQPARACAWLPWAAAWSTLNTGTPIAPNIYNPTNWDYSFSQTTLLNTTKDTPPGGGNVAFHWFLDAQPDATTSNGAGSGGVYQQIGVTPGVPLEYSYFWKAAFTSATNNWFEFLLIDGPFDIGAADGFSESAAGNNPAVIRKREMAILGGWGWEQVTNQSRADDGPGGARPTTLTPAGSVVTVVLKAGRLPGGAMESFWDNIVVSQAGGPNLIVDGDFEDYPQRTACDSTSMARNACEDNFWRWNAYTPSPPCPQPFGDTDGDQDMDMEDFAALQRCLDPDGLTALTEPCRCLDRPEPIFPNGKIDAFDLLTFIQCARGPGIPVDLNCGN